MLHMYVYVPIIKGYIMYTVPYEGVEVHVHIHLHIHCTCTWNSCPQLINLPSLLWPTRFDHINIVLWNVLCNTITCFLEGLQFRVKGKNIYTYICVFMHILVAELKPTVCVRVLHMQQSQYSTHTLPVQFTCDSERQWENTIYVPIHTHISTYTS